MSVADQLDLADERPSELLRLAGQRWLSWIDTDPVLGTALGGLAGLRGWLRGADPADSDDVLLALVKRGAVDGGNDPAAAAVVAWALLPAASAMAHRFSSLSANIDEIVAAELWIQVRTFPWQRLRRVAANIVMNTRARVLQECGVVSQVRRVDRTWATTVPNDPTAATIWDHLLTPGDAPARTAMDELLDVLDWACDHDVITAIDRAMLLCLVAAADRVNPVAVGRGWGGLMGNDVSAAVAIQLGVSAITVRRRTRRSLEALRAARPVEALCA